MAIGIGSRPSMLRSPGCWPQVTRLHCVSGGPSGPGTPGCDPWQVRLLGPALQVAIPGRSGFWTRHPGLRSLATWTSELSSPGCDPLQPRLLAPVVRAAIVDRSTFSTQQAELQSLATRAPGPATRVATVGNPDLWTQHTRSRFLAGRTSEPSNPSCNPWPLGLLDSAISIAIARTPDFSTQWLW